MITEFKLFEKLGIITSLYDIALKIAKELTIKDYYLAKLNYKGQDIEIECYHFNKSPDENYAIFQKIGDNKFKIRTSGKDIHISHIIHELKHLDYFMARDYELSEHGYLNAVGRFVSEKLRHLIKDPIDLISVLYYSDPNEFESFYNEYHHRLKSLIKNTKDKKKRREKIKNFLNTKVIYELYKDLNKNKFDIRDYFSTKAKLNDFIEQLYKSIDEFKDSDIQNITFQKKLKNQLKHLVLKFNKDEDEENTKQINRINHLINKSIQKNYKRFHRLFTLI